jgi:hypothetical protein
MTKQNVSAKKASNSSEEEGQAPVLASKIKYAMPSISPAKEDRVKKLVVYSLPKTGKTSSLMQLPKSLIIDLEDSSDYYEGSSFNIVQMANQEKRNPVKILKDIAKSIQESIIEKDGKLIYPYDYIIIDTVTAIEDLASPLATLLYKNSLLGKDYEGKDVVTDLPMGAGYNWLRKSFFMILEYFESLAPTIIYTAHVKDASIKKAGEELTFRDLQLTGKIKTLICKDADAIGLLYRDYSYNSDKDNVSINKLSFIKNEIDVVLGSRPAHLNDSEFVISSYNKDTKKLTTYWENIFLNIQKKK